MHTSKHTICYDPDGQIEAQLPLPPFRAAYENLIKTVLAWTDPDTLPERDYEQIALQLTGHARAVANDVRTLAVLLPKDSGAKALTDTVLGEAERRLSIPIHGTARFVQNRARLVRALYERRDVLQAVLPQVTEADSGTSSTPATFRANSATRGGR